MPLPLPRASVGHQLCCVPQGMNSGMVVLAGALPVLPRWQEGLGSVSLANTEWSAITETRSFWLLLLRSPFGHWRHAVASDLHRQEFLTTQGSKLH